LNSRPRREIKEQEISPKGAKALPNTIYSSNLLPHYSSCTWFVVLNILPFGVLQIKSIPFIFLQF
jgi:hypothetical protein